MKRAVLFGLVGVMPLAASSCDVLLRERALDAARQSWTAAEIDSYSWTVELSCFCVELPGAVEFVVVDGEVVSSSAEVWESYPGTVEELFDQIERQIDGDRLEVTYHPELGYPETVYLDPIAGAADDETSYQTSGFTE